MDKIAIIYMGGTFGCIGEPLSPMPAKQFLKELKTHCKPHYPHLAYFAAPVIKDSSELHASDWLKLVKYIQTLSTRFQNFILIHGTDTLSYAAAFLAHLLQTDIRLLITGSQLPFLDSTGQVLYSKSDAWDNLSFAIEYIPNLDYGVGVAFAGQLFNPFTLYKQHTSEAQAFLGQPLQYKIKLAHEFKTFVINTKFIQQIDKVRILNIMLYPSPPDLLYQNLLTISLNPPDILVLQCFGAGNLPYSEKIKQQLAYLKQHCWIIISSQVLYGSLSSQYATGSWLKELDLTIEPHYSQADAYARILLSYLYCHNNPVYE